MSKSLGHGLLLGFVCISLIYYFSQQKKEPSFPRALLEDEARSDERLEGELERQARHSNRDKEPVTILPEKDLSEIMDAASWGPMETLAERVVASYEEGALEGNYEKLLLETEAAVREIKAEYKKRTGKEMHSYLDTTSLERQADQALENRLIAPDEYQDYLMSLIGAAEVEHMLTAE